MHLMCPVQYDEDVCMTVIKWEKIRPTIQSRKLKEIIFLVEGR